MKELELKIYVDDDIFDNEHEWYYGALKDKKVRFIYHNKKTGKETVKPFYNYADALYLARSRQPDKRYKNFEFYILKIEGE